MSTFDTLFGGKGDGRKRLIIIGVAAAVILLAIVIVAAVAGSAGMPSILLLLIIMSFSVSPFGLPFYEEGILCQTFRKVIDSLPFPSLCIEHTVRLRHHTVLHLLHQLYQYTVV